MTDKKDLRTSAGKIVNENLANVRGAMAPTRVSTITLGPALVRVYGSFGAGDDVVNRVGKIGDEIDEFFIELNNQDVLEDATGWNVRIEASTEGRPKNIISGVVKILGMKEGTSEVVVDYNGKTYLANARKIRLVKEA